MKINFLFKVPLSLGKQRSIGTFFKNITGIYICRIKIDNTEIQAGGEIYSETKSTLQHRDDISDVKSTIDVLKKSMVDLAFD